MQNPDKGSRAGVMHLLPKIQAGGDKQGVHQLFLAMLLKLIMSAGQ